MTQRFFLSLVLAFSLALSSCTKRDDDGTQMVFHGVHRDDVKTWDPANAYDMTSLDIVPSVYEQLYQYHYLRQEYRIVPYLAADYPKYSADRLTLTIPIRSGIQFHEDPSFGGKPRELKAQDFIYGLKRLALPGIQSQGWWILDGRVTGINLFHERLVKAAPEKLWEEFETPVEGLEAVDDHTLRIKLTRPYPQLLYVLAMLFTSPVAHEADRAYRDEKGNLNDHPVGTGPFILKDWKRGHRITLERNPKYHPDFYPVDGDQEFRTRGYLADAGKPLPFLDKLVIDVIKEDNPAWLRFLKGQQDIMEIPKDSFNQAIVNQSNVSPQLASKGIRLNVESGSYFYYIDFNLKDRVLSNKYLRQALSSAINRDKWIFLFTNGRGKKMTHSLPPGMPDRPADSKLKYDLNLEQAKALLAKAGYPGGKGLPVLNLDMRRADSFNRQLGEFFSEQWAKIGVSLNVIYNTFPAYLEKAKKGNLQISYGGWGLDYPDPENVYQLLYGANRPPGPNSSNFDHPEFNKFYEKLAVMQPGSDREDLIKKMEDIVQEEVPWAFGYYVVNYQLSQPWLHNYRASEMIQNKYKYYRVDRQSKRRYMESN